MQLSSPLSWLIDAAGARLLLAGDAVEAILAALAAEAASDSAHSGWAAETRAGLRARPNRSDIRKWQKR
jgi:hypothetical protein